MLKFLFLIYGSKLIIRYNENEEWKLGTLEDIFELEAQTII